MAKFFRWICNDPTSDGLVYMLLGGIIFAQGYLSGEEAYKYVNPYLLFWTKCLLGSVGGSLGGLKSFLVMFRSRIGKQPENVSDTAKSN